MCERQAKTCGVLQVAGARGVLDFGLLGQGIAHARPEVLRRSLGDDLGVDEDVRRAVGIRIALERAVVVVHDGNGGRGGAVRTNRRHRKDDLLELDGSGLHGVERLAAAACDEHVGFLAGRGVHDLGDIGTCTVGAIDARLQNLDVGTCQRSFDTWKCCGQCPLATDDCDLGRSVFGQRSGQLV